MRTEADYAALVTALDHVLDAGGADEDNPLALPADYLGDWLAEWEANDPMPPAASGVGMLRHLMREHGLRQSDLAESSAILKKPTGRAPGAAGGFFQKLYPVSSCRT